MSFPDVKMGLERTKGDTLPSFDEMRQAILKGSRDSPLINQCLRQAEYLGLSGEDKYVMLAYHALIELEARHKQVMKFVSLHPNPMQVLTPDQP